MPNPPSEESASGALESGDLDPASRVPEPVEGPRSDPSPLSPAWPQPEMEIRLRLRWAERLPAALPFLAVLVLAILAAQTQLKSPDRARDFPTFFLAAYAVSERATIYGPDSLSALAADAGIAQRVFPYLYPPFLAQLLVPLVPLGYTAARTLWVLIATVALAAAFALLSRLPSVHSAGPRTAHEESRRRVQLIALGIALLAAAYPAFIDFKNGQVNTVVLFWIAAYIALAERKHSWPAGACLAVATLIKVVPVVFLLDILVRKDGKCLAGFAAATAVLIAGCSAATGVDSLGDFIRFADAAGYGRVVPGNLPPSDPFNLGIAGALTRALGDEDPWVPPLTLAWLAALALPAALLRRQGRLKQTPPRLMFLAVLMLLSAPFMWVHQFVTLALGIIPIALHHAHGALLGGPHRLLFAAWSVAALLSGLPYANLGPVLGLGRAADALLSVANLAAVLLLYTLSLWLDAVRPTPRVTADASA